ncbi:MAG: hypothetical protein RLZZ618_3614 [Pseudomonadota bacterium]
MNTLLAASSRIAPSVKARQLLARTHQAIGWAGAAGVLLLALSLAIGLSLKAPVEGTPRAVQSGVASPAAREVQKLPVQDAFAAKPALPSEALRPLPSQREVKALLAQVQQLAVASGVGWPAAEYRLAPATDTEGAALEIRCALKGTYPQLRSLLSTWLAEVPGLTLRDLTLTRASTEVTEVEAKLVLAILLRDDDRVQARATP